MKKLITLFVLTLVFISCNQTNSVQTKEFKTAYIDTQKLMDESTEAKDIEARYKDKSKTIGNQLEAEAKSLENEKKNFQANAQKNGQAWAQQKYGELQQRAQQLSYAEQGMMQQLQQESGKELDSLIIGYKKVIKDYGKEKGYDYIYGTGEPASILYAKDNYDITKEIIKIINEKYKSSDKKEDKKEVKK